jgi:hypothetical protein
MKDNEREEWEEWLEENKGIMFKIEWFRIILDEAQYALHLTARLMVVSSKILMFVVRLLVDNYSLHASGV